MLIRKNKYKLLATLLTVLATIHTPLYATTQAPVDESLNSQTRLVMLGTGHPGFDNKRAGQAILVVVDKALFQFDAGPGYMKNYNGLADKEWMPEEILFSNDSVYGAINKLFITHLDSDHILGIDEFLLRPWVQGRSEPVLIVGPKGTQQLVDKTIEAYEADIDHRLYGSQPANSEGFKANVVEISDNQVVYEDDKVSIEAFKVPHGSWPDGMAFGYRVQTPTKTIVLSGDTRFEPATFDHYRDADIVVHEVMSEEGVSRLKQNWQDYMYDAHTSTKQLAKLANEVKPGLLVLNHAIFFGVTPEALMKEFTDDYQGKAVLADDLMIFE